MRGKFEDLTGKVFGRYTVIEMAEKRSGAKSSKWLVQCECGEKRIVTGVSIRNSVSCGCYMREQLGDRMRTHGASATNLYRRYLSMHQRCYNKNSTEYKNYGMKGISVCEQWHQFEQFRKDMGEPPAGMTLDRIDVTGNYCPENCRWATKSEQVRNRRITLTVTHQDTTMTFADFVEKHGLQYRRTYERLYRQQWSIDRILATK